MDVLGCTELTPIFSLFHPKSSLVLFLKTGCVSDLTYSSVLGVIQLGIYGRPTPMLTLLLNQSIWLSDGCKMRYAFWLLGELCLPINPFF